MLQNQVAILGLGTDVPKCCVTQDEYAQFVIEALQLSGKQARGINILSRRSRIKQRYFVIDDLLKSRAEWQFLPQDYPQHKPSMSKRNQLYKQFAPLLAEQAAVNALRNWGGRPDAITHIIFVSCTGVVAPGVEFSLITALGLRPSVQRYGINLMGCFGAIRGLAAAHAFASLSPDNRVLVVCTELCSLHFQADMQAHYIISNAIFADGAGAAIVGQPSSTEHALWHIKHVHALALSASSDKMSWEASEEGFLMYMSGDIHEQIASQLIDFANVLLDGHDTLSACAWPLHPGGKVIIEHIEKTCHLAPWQIQATWRVWEDYGNMSSATLIFVLMALAEQPEHFKHALAMAFGPGLSLEGLLLARDGGV